MTAARPGTRPVALQRMGGVLVSIVLAVSFAGCGVHSTGPTDRPAAAGRAPSGSRPSADEPSEASASGESRVPRGLSTAQQAVDRADPDQVAVAFVIRLEAWDTALDDRPNDAVRRAVAFATPQLRDQLLADEPVAAPGHRWDQLRRHRGWTAVRTRVGGLGPAPTTERSAVRAVSCTVVDHGSTGWISFPDDNATYIVRLRKTGSGGEWTVVGYTIQ